VKTETLKFTEKWKKSETTAPVVAKRIRETTKKVGNDRVR